MRNKYKDPKFPPKFESKEEENFALKYVGHQLKEQHKPILARNTFDCNDATQ